MRTKPCISCGKDLPLSDYYAHPQMGDGHLNKCKACVIEYQKKRRIEKLEELREYDRRRANLPHRVEGRKAYAESENGKKSHNAAAKRWNEKYAYRKAATVYVAKALNNGTLKRQPCWVCGKKAQAHHPDYSTPIDVVWLCPKHHAETHKLARNL